MAEALYGPNGFYTSAVRAGRRGDFLTSPEVGPLFGTVLARWIHAEFVRLGEPADFLVVEVGAGPGTLARSVLAAAPQWRNRYVCVEVSEAQRASHPDGVISTHEMPTGFTGVVIANELLDNLSFRLAVFDGGWREAYVVQQADGSAAEVLRPAPAEWASILPQKATHGSRAPMQEEARKWVQHALACLVAGTVLDWTGFCPVVKRIWTPAWVLYSGGWCCLFLASFHVLIDLAGRRAWAFPLTVIGMTAALLALAAVFALGTMAG